MTDASFMAALLDSLKDPILVADTDHVTRYMNKAAIAYYDEGESLIGRSLLDCHNELSQRMMKPLPTRLPSRQIPVSSWARYFTRSLTTPLSSSAVSCAQALPMMTNCAQNTSAAVRARPR